MINNIKYIFDKNDFDNNEQNIYIIQDQNISEKIVLSKKINNILIININSQIQLDIDHAEGLSSQLQIINIYQNKQTKSITTSNLVNDSKSDIYILSMLTKGSDIIVDGNIYIGPGAIGSSGHLLEENLVLDPQVKIYAKPVLDVQNSQVSASHGARISKIDNKSLFYMMSRGLNKEQATNIILDGYINKILDKLELNDQEKEGLKDIIMR